MNQTIKKYLLLVINLMISIVANAYDFEVGGIYFNKDGNCAIVTSGDSKYSGDVSIPSTVNYGGMEYSVTGIGDNAFNSCSDLTSVTIGNSVTTIGNSAFWECSGLTSVTIPNSVTCVGDSVFSNCSGLISVTIGNSVTSIGKFAFRECSGLTSIKVESGNTTYDSRNDCNAIIETASNTLVAGCKNTVIPNSVTTIEGDAFYGCSGLTSVTIPNSVTSIGNYAFGFCSGLTSVTIPNSVTSIGDGAFFYCTGLTSVTIPNSVTSIGNSAFVGCSGLTSVTIPNSVTSIGSRAFDRCSGLTSIKVESGNTTYDSRNDCNAIIETTSNTLVTGCKNTVIPNSVTSIGGDAFSNCDGLTSVTIPNSVTIIGDYAFYSCDGLTSVTIPNSVTSIGNYAFQKCSGLTSVIIPNSVTSIGDGAFFYCTGLTSVTIPNSVTSIGGGAFYGCRSLTSVTIPNSVTSIGGYAFYYCSGLTSVTIGNSVTSIGNYAFGGCSKLESVISEIEIPFTIASSVFGSDTESNGQLTVPKGKKSVYESTDGWKEFSNIVESSIPGDGTSSNAYDKYAVDLGLSSLWSSVNLGATKSTGIGNYYAWGETKSKTSFKKEEYEYYDASSDGFTDIGNVISDTEYDAVKAAWGGEWHMPTYYDFQELCEQCTWTVVTLSGVQCFEVKGPSGKVIYLPMTGYYTSSSTTPSYETTKARYWSGTLFTLPTSDPIPNSFAYSYNLDINGNPRDSQPTKLYRYWGAVIRPVRTKIPVTTYSLSIQSSSGGSVSYNGTSITNATKSFTVSEGSSVTLTITPNSGYKLSSLTVNGTDVTSMVSNNSYTISSITANTTVVSTFAVTTDAKFPIPEAVDLGLSVKWAKWNMGASSEYDSGDWYGWGDPTGEKTSTSSDDYANGYTEPSICGTSLDIATQNWGEGWRLPTADEVKELLDKCKRTAVTKNGVAGYNLTLNGETIFLPKGGYKNNGVISYENYSCYWTGEQDDALHPYELAVYSSTQYAVITNTNKALHLHIRPVYDEGSIPGGGSSTNAYDKYAVDLGLSSLWSSVNLGATKETQSGKFYAWGETESKTSFTKDNYAYTIPGGEGENTYQWLGDDSGVISGTEYDAVKVAWGGDWVMPTYYDLDELYELCKWEATTKSGVAGYKVTGPNGNSIFLPLTGYYNGSELQYAGQYARYWAGTVRTLSKKNEWGISYNLNINPENNVLLGTQRHWGAVIRPVRTKSLVTTYSLSIQSGAGGSVSYNGTTVTNTTRSFTVNEGTSATITITPNSGYRLSRLTVNGTNVASSVSNNQYRISNITANTTVVVAFEQIPATTYSLSIQSGAGGSVSYGGTTITNTTRSFTVSEGTSATITISPNSGYRLSRLTVNGTNVTSSVSNSQYTISNITANTSVVATFEQIPATTYSLSIQSGAGGSVSFDGTTVTNTTRSFTVNEGTSATITITPNTGYKLSKLTVNGTNVTSGVSNNKYTINSISANTTVVVTFEQITYTLSVQATGNGTVTYNSTATKNTTRSFTVNHGSSATLSISPDSGYRLALLKVNGTNVTSSVSNNQYTISNITANTTVVATFEQIPATTYSLSIQSGAGGSVSYDGTTITNKTQSFTVAEGSSATITVSPNSGYKLASLVVNGTDVTSGVANNQYTISNIKANTTVVVTFKAIPQTISVDGINYEVRSATDYTLNVGKGNYSGHVIIPATVSYGGDTWTVAGVVDRAFNLSAITAITWNPNTAIGDGAFGTQTNPNLLLYVKSEAYAPANVQNVIANGRAKKIVLTDAASENDFNCPEAFTAEEISYTHRYGMTTGLGECRGWETIALPFDVKQFTHESKGGLVPFKAYYSDSPNKPFWLYQLSSIGFVEAESILAYTPYIISMPYNDYYANNYHLNGNVTFSSANVKVGVTVQKNTQCGDKTFIPNFALQAASEEIFPLNVDNEFFNHQDYYAEGSHFIRNSRAVHPFEAFMTTTSTNAKSTISIFEDMTTKIPEILLRKDAMNVVKIYNMQGQLVKSERTTIEKALNGLAKGVYIVNGKKIAVQ